MSRLGLLRISLAGILAWAALGAGPADPGKKSHLQLAVRAGALSDEQVKALEEKVNANPEDIEDRIRLLGYYSTHHQQIDELQARARHIIWLIDNHPDEAILATPFGRLSKQTESAFFPDGRAAWEKQVQAHPQDLKILRNAMLYPVAEGAQSESYLMTGESLDPADSFWPDRLGALYKSRISTAENKEDLANWTDKALEKYETAQKLTPAPSDQLTRLRDMATAALEEFDQAHQLRTKPAQKLTQPNYQALVTLETVAAAKAKSYAGEMLAKAQEPPAKPNSGDAIHHGNLILGRLALHQGDVMEAKKCLEAAGNAPTSYWLNLTGPNMMLAKELLERKQRDAVLKYLDQVGKFWKSNDGKLQEWTATVRKGKIPDFGVNLYY